ncbi:kinesin motor domain-containing protein, putative [Eimeria maxima]|uniref:Kinesin motor domain-containing protein, putative n=1 Tax=Eimeria maxima TaxID=5804 RepID=U6M2S0_EIMMA|nr:kinesin motor domain-containing protein, putative [Eimeria maxima]CDJ56724.1 kinesin motor domain-containing protein, putative [Eimeria maxima]
MIQNPPVTQLHKLPTPTALLSHLLPHPRQQQLQQLQQQTHRQLTKPVAAISHKHLEDQQVTLATQFVPYAGRRSRSNSSLASQEKRSPSQINTSSRGLVHGYSTAMGSQRCGHPVETREAALGNPACSNRLSLGSTNSSLWSGHQFSSRRYLSTESEHISAAVASAPAGAADAADAIGAPSLPAPASPSVSAAVPSSSFSVGGESCTDWGTISAEDCHSSSSSGSGSSNVFVAVRVRPLSDSELRQGDNKSISVVAPQSLLVTEWGAGGGPRGRRVRRRCFIFDTVFGECASQEEVFQLSTSPLLQELFKGVNASVFAYGATAAGKTYTMLGTETGPGVMPRALQLLFQQVSSEREKEYVLSCCFVEIYNETIRDLLGPRGEVCELREDPERGVLLQHATVHRLCSPQQALLLLFEGNSRRTQEATNANQTSSRSHAVLQVNVILRGRDGEETQVSKLSLVDLAGSERASQTSNHGQRMTEGASINRSLLALGNVINALTARSGGPSSGNCGSLCGAPPVRFVPYRDSKLTRLLKDSLGGCCRTAMIATVSPASSHQEETLNTLKYAKRAKAIRNNSAQFHKLQKCISDTDTHNDPNAVAGLKAKLHQLQCQLHRQDLHERLNMRRRLPPNPITTFLDAAEEPEASLCHRAPGCIFICYSLRIVLCFGCGSLASVSVQPKDLQEQPEAERERRGRAAAAAAAMPHPTLQHATAEAVNLLLEDIDALAAENALLTEQVAALQASLRESGDRFAFLQSLAQRQQQFDGEFLDSADISAAAAEAAKPGTDAATAARNDKLCWEGIGGFPAMHPSDSSSPAPATEEEFRVLLRMRPFQSQQQLLQPRQQAQQQDEEFDVPTEMQEPQHIECNDEKQQQQQVQPLALQPQGVICSKDTLQFDEYFSPQSVSATEGSPATGPTPVAGADNSATAGAPAKPTAAGGGRSLALSPFRFFGKSGTFSKLCSTVPTPLDARSTVVSGAPAAGAAAPTTAAGHDAGGTPGKDSKGPVKG